MRKLGAWGWTRPSVTVRDGVRWWRLDDGCPNLDREALTLSHPLIFFPIQTPAKSKPRADECFSIRSTWFLNTSPWLLSIQITFVKRQNLLVRTKKQRGPLLLPFSCLFFFSLAVTSSFNCFSDFCPTAHLLYLGLFGF